ncbi:MAG: STAS domain-containing protein [Clostridia bacterium]|nr:STAS domain-containing protein [Clostridia bacterium]
MKPMFFQTLKGYSVKQLSKDIVAGLVVAIIALPLSIALAIASGVAPEKGIYTAVIAGCGISVLGGSTVQIAGPTAAFATIVAGIVYNDGMDALIVATIIAGVLLILMGVFKLGNLIKFIPFTITTGFTAGIAVTILFGQLKDFFGVTYPAGMETIETIDKLHAFFAGFNTFGWQALVIGLISLAVLIIMPKITDKIPGSLVAVLVAILLVKFVPVFQVVPTIGNQYSDIPKGLPGLTLPSEFNFEIVKNSFSNGVTIAVLAAIESLLSCVVADEMVRSKHNSNVELVAQGAGNIASVLFGGIPATGAIARTAANVKNGGRTPVAGMVHAVVLALVLLVLMPYAKLIPMPTIAAILIMVAYNMSHWHVFVRVIKTAPKSDIAVLLITFLLTVVFDLVVAIAVGMLLACLLFIKRMSDETGVKSWECVKNGIESEKAEREKMAELPNAIRVYDIAGPLFFGSADQIEKIALEEDTKVLIVRMRSVTALDSTAMNALEKLHRYCDENAVVMVLSHINEQPMKVIRKAKFDAVMGEENICVDISAAIERAAALVELKKEA